MNKDIKLSAAGKPIVLVPKHILNFDECLDVTFQPKKQEEKKNERNKNKS